MRRRPDGSYEPVDGDTAIAEVAAGLARARDTYGGLTIFYYGGGGQGNHLNGGYASATRAAPAAATGRTPSPRRRPASSGSTARCSAATAREHRVHRGGGVRGQEPVAVPQLPARPHHAEGDRPRPEPPCWSCSIPAAPRPPSSRTTTWPCARAPTRCLAALAAVIVQEGLLDRRWLAQHAVGLIRSAGARRGGRRGLRRASRDLDPDLKSAARPAASPVPSVAVFEDLGVQMNLHPPVQPPRQAAVAAHRELRQPGRAIRPHQRGRADRRRQRRPRIAGGRRSLSPARHHLGPGAGQRDRGGDPHRPPRPLPASRRRTANPAHSLADSPWMRGAAGAGLRGGDRRRHDRDRPAGRLRAAGLVAVREVGGDVLQLRVPGQLLPPAPAAAGTPGRHAARTGDPRPHRRGPGRPTAST